jgi:hypothetical protein
MAPWLRFLFLFGFLPAGFVFLCPVALLFFLTWVFARHFKDR